MAARLEDLTATPWAPLLRGQAGASPGGRAAGAEVLTAPADGARIYRFPVAAIRARRARRHAIFRRRAALGVITVLITAALIAATGPEGSAPAASGRAPDRVVVRAGQTLWDLAARHAPPSVDPRAYVDALIDLNGLAGGLEAGDTIELPR